MFKRSKKPDSPGRQPQRQVTPRDQQTVFSYRAARKSQETKENRQPEMMKQRMRSMRWLTLDRVKAIAFIVLVFGALIYISWLNTTPKITILGSSNEALLQNIAVYRQAATKLLTESVTNRNKLTLNEGGIADKLEAMYPELASVTVQVPLLGHNPQIVLESAPLDLRLQTSTGQVFILAASGKAMAEVSNQSYSGIPLINDQSGLPVHVGSVALPNTDVAFIQTVTSQLVASHLAISSLTLPQATSELDIHLNGRPYLVKFNLEADAKAQVGTYLAVNKYLTSLNIIPSQYVDVRVPGRAYYK